MQQRKRRRRGIIEDQKENDFEDEMEAIPSTSSEVIQKVSFANIQQFSPRLTRKNSEFFPFEFLPKHVQEKVVSYVPLRNRVQLERVSRSWRHILLNSWRKVTTMSIPATLTENLNIRPISDIHVCGLLHKCGRYLEELDFFIPHFTIGQHILYSVSHICTLLTRFVLRSDIDGQSMTFLLKTYTQLFSQLTSLEIYYHNVNSIHNGLRAVSRTLTKVESFYLECYSLPTNIAALFPNSPVMKKFTVKMKQRPSSSSPSSIDPRVCPSFVGEFFSYLADVYPLIEELNVSILALAIPDEEMLRCQLTRIGTQRRIKKLSLRLVSSGQWWGSHSLRSLSSFHHLEDLSLTACQLPYDFASILHHAGISNKLKSLRLSIIGHLDVHRLLEVFTTLPQLHHFSLLFTSDFPAPTAVDTQLFISVFMVCHRLSSLELVECPGIEKVALVNAIHSAFHHTSHFFADESLPPTVSLRLVDSSSGIIRRKRGGVRCCGNGMQKGNEYTCTVYRECRKKIGVMSSTEHSSSD